VVRMIDAAGQEIGTHGYMHDKVTDMTPYEFEQDLDRSLNALAKRTSRPIVGHRASNFSIVEGTLWALDILARYGIEYDSSIFPVQRERYGIPDYPNRLPHTVHLAGGRSIVEVPMSTLNLGRKALPISGGGYLRLYPYAVTDLFIRRRNSQGLPAMVYFHPWELDADQDRVKTGLVKSFQHYVNLDTTEWKLDRLLGRHAFGAMADILSAGPVHEMLGRDPVRIRDARGAVGTSLQAVALEKGSKLLPAEADGLLAA
jgi:polysaccharide deacetylase family protein (PEP-CTERM system associated)